MVGHAGACWIVKLARGKTPSRAQPANRLKTKRKFSSDDGHRFSSHRRGGLDWRDRGGDLGRPGDEAAE